MKKLSGVKRELKRIPVLVWLFACVSIISGCAKNTGGTVYLTGSSIIKLTVDSKNGTKEASALNKAGEALLANQVWKGEPEEVVLDSLIQGMQEEDVKQIYVDILGEEKGWENAEIQKLSEYFSAERYESSLQIEVRRVADLDAAGSGGHLQAGTDSESSFIIETGEGKSSKPEESPSPEESSKPEESPSPEESSKPEESPSPEEVSSQEEPSPEESPSVRETRPAAETAGRSAAAPEPAATTVTPEETPVSESDPEPEETLPLETPEADPEPSMENLPKDAVTRNQDVYIPTGKTEAEEPFGPGW